MTPRGCLVRGLSIRTEIATDHTPADSSNTTRAPVGPAAFFAVSGFWEVPPMSMPSFQALTHHSSSLWTKSEVMLLMATLYPLRSVKKTSRKTFDWASWSVRYWVAAGTGSRARRALHLLLDPVDGLLIRGDLGVGRPAPLAGDGVGAGGGLDDQRIGGPDDDVLHPFLEVGVDLAGQVLGGFLQPGADHAALHGPDRFVEALTEEVDGPGRREIDDAAQNDEGNDADREHLQDQLGTEGCPGFAPVH